MYKTSTSTKKNKFKFTTEKNQKRKFQQIILKLNCRSRIWGSFSDFIVRSMCKAGLKTSSVFLLFVLEAYWVLYSAVVPIAGSLDKKRKWM